MSTKKISDYTDSELLGLTNEQFNDAIRLEAIDRGVKPPIPISDALRTSEWRGYQHPGDRAVVYMIRVCGRRGSMSDTGAAYLTMEAAEKALTGMVSVDQDYTTKAWKLYDANPSIVAVSVGADPSKQKWAKFEEYYQDDAEFDEIAEEATKRLSDVRQADYTKRVMGERKVEYLRLANGDEQIARNFWAKAERTEWPAGQV